ncbi:MAG: 2-oxoglutarate dehydrogenase E1 component, partial [Hyphomonadaceae bacterium]
MADDGRSAPNAALLETSFLYGANAGFVEEMHERYLRDPNSIDPSWRAFFARFADEPEIVAKAVRGPAWAPANGDAPPTPVAAAPLTPAALPAASPETIRESARDSVRALMMIRAFRTRGHLAAQLDPLGVEQRAPQPELDPASYGFGPQDMDRPIFIDHVLGL